MQKLRAKNFLTLTQKFQKSLQLILGIWVKHRMNEQFCRWQMRNDWALPGQGTTDSSEAKGAREHATFSIQHWWLTKPKEAICRNRHIQRKFCKVKLEEGVRGKRIFYYWLFLVCKFFCQKPLKGFPSHLEPNSLSLLRPPDPSTLWLWLTLTQVFHI